MSMLEGRYAYDNGSEEWYHKGRLHRNDGPAVILASGNQYWYQYGSLHREDGPAIIQVDGSRYWYQKGHMHRADGPAIIYASGSCKYWYEGYHQETAESFQKCAKLTDEEMSIIILTYGHIS